MQSHADERIHKKLIVGPVVLEYLQYIKFIHKRDLYISFECFTYFSALQMHSSNQKRLCNIIVGSNAATAASAFAFENEVFSCLQVHNRPQMLVHYVYVLRRVPRISKELACTPLTVECVV